MGDEAAGGERDLERELLEDYPDLALLLRRAATMHRWQPSGVGEELLRQLAGAVAYVLEHRLPPDAANAYVAEIAADLQRQLHALQREHGRLGTRSE
jgi:hypothetical protein